MNKFQILDLWLMICPMLSIVAKEILNSCSSMGSELALKMEERERLSLRSSMIKVRVQFIKDGPHFWQPDVWAVENTLKLYSGPTIQSRPCRPMASFGLVLRNACHFLFRSPTLEILVMRRGAFVQDLPRCESSWCRGTWYGQGRAPASPRCRTRY